MCDARRWIFFCLLLVSVEGAIGQRLGLLPPNVHWQQLRHDSLRIIFPKGHEETAIRAASRMLSIARLDPIGQTKRYKPISVILQPETNLANGYVGLAPYVSEFYLQPHENVFELGSLPWVDLLAIHEYRHVQQVNAAKTGLSNLVHTLFGDLAFSGMYNLAIPDWFREGDAVFAETKWTSQGRGRLSYFTLPFYDRLIEDDPWDYYKVRRGSYREYTPGFYPLGYLLIQYGNHEFGEAVWDSIVREAPRFKDLLRPFSGIVKEKYGKRNHGFYLDAMDWICARCRASTVEDIDYPVVPLTEKDQKADYLDVVFPAVGGDGHIYAAVTTFDRITGIYRFESNGKRSKVADFGLQQTPYFDMKNEIFAWTELRYDPRWVRRDKNVLIVFNPQKKGSKRLQIKPDKGFFTPVLDIQGKQVAVLHVDKAGQYEVRIYDAENGILRQQLPNPDNLYFAYPTITPDRKSIIGTVRDHLGRMCIMEQDLATGKMRQITHYSYNVLGRPALQDNWIFITAGMGLLDQVYAVDRKEGIFYQVSGGNSAHYNPAWDPVQESIVVAQYHVDGHKLVRLPSMPLQWRMTNLDDGIKDVDGAEGRDLVRDPLIQKNFSIKKYSPWSNAINVHSWLVTADDPVWGVELRSNNILNDMALSGGYEYNRNTRSSGPYINARLGMWFPELLVGVSSISREIELDEDSPFRVTNERLNAGFRIPLIFTPGRYTQTLQVSSVYNAGISRLRPRIEQLEDFKFNYINHRLTMSKFRNRAYRQAEPSFAQRIDLSYSHNVKGVSISQFYGSADFAIPAFHPSHYMLLQGEYLSQDIGDGFVQLSSIYSGPRGFDVQDGRHQYSVSATYGLPILYPDRGIGNIFYSRRFRLQPFFDIGFSEDENGDLVEMQSTGAELIFDFDFPPVSVGVRYARLLKGYTGSPNQFELFFPVQRF